MGRKLHLPLLPCRVCAQLAAAVWRKKEVECGGYGLSLLRPSAASRTQGSSSGQIVSKVLRQVGGGGVLKTEYALSSAIPASRVSCPLNSAVSRSDRHSGSREIGEGGRLLRGEENMLQMTSIEYSDAVMNWIKHAKIEDGLGLLWWRKSL